MITSLSDLYISRVGSGETDTGRVVVRNVSGTARHLNNGPLLFAFFVEKSVKKRASTLDFV
jgi:hypothetical protein